MIFLVLGLCATASANGVPVARFAGRVVDAEGRPVAGARLWLQVVRADGGFGFLARNLGTADEQGRFAAEVPQTPIPYGENRTRPWPKRWRYLVAAWHPDHGVGWARAKRDEAVEIRMTRPAALRGKVLDADGAPLAEVSVGLDHLRLPRRSGEADTISLNWPEPRPLWARAQTDAKGRFELTGLPAGASTQIYTGFSNAHRYLWPDQQPPDPEEVTLSEQAQELTVKLVRRAVIAGRLLLPDGKTPAAGIGLKLQERGPTDTHDAHVDYGSSDAQGRYRFARVRAGRYAIWIYRGEYEPVVAEDVEVVQSERRDLPPVVLRPRPDAWVEGRVLDVDTGTPIAGAGIRARRTEPRYGIPPVMTPLFMSGPDGRYRARVAPVETSIYVGYAGSANEYVMGGYTVTWVRVEGRALARITANRRKPSSRTVRPKPGEVITGIDLYLKRGAEVSGTVIGPDGSRWPGHPGPFPPSRERVTVSPDPAWVLGIRRDFTVTFISPEGTFSARGLYPGVPVVLSVFDDDLEIGGAVRVTPELDQCKEVVIRLGPAARVQGRVLRADGKPVAGAHVRVVGVAARYAKADAEGRFDLAGGVPGLPCTVSANALSDTGRNRSLQGLSKTVRVRPGQQVVDVGDIVLAPERE